MKTTAAITLGATILIAVGIMCQRGVRAHASARAAETLNQQEAELSQRIGAVEAAVRATEVANAKLEEEISASKLPENPAAPPPKPNPYAVIASDPVKLAAYVRDFRASLDLSLGGLKNLPGFSPELFEKLKDLKAAREQNRLDILAAAETQGMPLNSPAYRALQREAAAQTAKGEAELLGPLLPSYQEFDHTQALRDAVRRLASTEVFPDTPLTATQVEQVVGVLAQHAKRGNDGTVRGYTLNLSEAMPELQGLLSPAAIDTLRWSPPGGVEDHIISRTNQIIAPLNAGLPEQKRRDAWSLYMDPNLR